MRVTHTIEICGEWLYIDGTCIKFVSEKAAEKFLQSLLIKAMEKEML
jgi:hypothetical protein